MLSLVVYVSPVTGIPVRAGDPKLPPGDPAAASLKPPQSPCPTSTSKAVVGEFGPVIHLPLVPVHLSVLPDRRVLFWRRDKSVGANGEIVKGVTGRSEAYVWNVSDGSNKTDVATWRPHEGNWYVTNSSTGASRVTQWGGSGDTPVPGDYDGDGRADLAVYRPADGGWYIIDSSTGRAWAFGWGIPGDVPAPAWSTRRPSTLRRRRAGRCCGGR
ncbi:MAG TPA: VCBS repeat-containing protein [Pyrinomonadaceae bacterium]|jgi:hypothetical protein|nr:VCBS repeat-containing protein [Pyrinomonadaceae bacterium]